ncbi:MAG: riboflavin biosynthesis protein RibF [Victivallaceae bacterium]|nr:riboflavin biosynthesis protein RibF [Victivallaceae bacterium]
MTFKDKISGAACIAIGVFDGVHIGHRRIVDELRAMADRRQCRAVAVSFMPHPRTVVAPASAPRLLVSPERRIELLKSCGADDAVLLPFTVELSKLSPSEFLERVFNADNFTLRGIVVGSSWRFGHRAAGGCGELSAFCRAKQLDFQPVDEVTADGAVVSSSRIRTLIATGRLADAAGLLGRPPELSGYVTGGLKLAGSRLEHPTANIIAEYGVLPPDGVYAAGLRSDDGVWRPAALNIGTTPTAREYGADGRRIEAHVLEYSGDLYGRKVTVELIKFMREERCFGSLEELKRQIEIDVTQIKAVASGEK